MTSLLRKATGRLTHGAATPKASEPRPARDTTPTKLNSFMPRLLNKKHTIATLSSRPTGVTPTLRSSASTRVASTSASSLHHGEPPSSTIPILDIFDEDSLSTAMDIRNMIAVTEDEGRRIVEAFNDLEATTVRRLQKQNARRLPTTTPANIDVLLQGREWREHRLVPHSSNRHVLSLVDSDTVSLRSSDTSGSRSRSLKSKKQNSLLQSKSVASLSRVSISSPFSPHFRSSSYNIPRKNSVSSETSSTQGISSSTSGGMLSPPLSPLSPTLSLSRSATHLPLARTHLRNSPSTNSTDTLGCPLPDGIDLDDDVELADIRKRREELISRYTTRLGFLRAKLKGAELHEKLLKK